MQLFKIFNYKFDLFSLACIYYIADLLLPIIQYYSSVYINIFIVIIILFTIIQRSNILKKHLTSFILILLLTLVYRLHFADSLKSVLVAFYQTALFITPILLSIFLISKNDFKTIKLLLFTSLIFLTVTSITSSYGLIEYPLASRQLATGMQNDSNALIYAQNNIAGFTIVYMIPVVLPLIFSMYITKNLKFTSLLLFTLPLMYFVYKSQYTTAIISLTIVIITSFLVYKFSLRNLILLSIFIALVFLLLKPNLSLFIREIANTQDQEVSIRLNAIGDKIQNRSSYSETIEGRQNAYLVSINTFFSAPFLGGLISNTGIQGGHSFILDMFASFGLISIIALYLFYKKILINFYFSHKTKNYYRLMILAFSISIFLSIFNTSPNIFAIGFFVPIVAYYIQYRKYYGIS